MAIVVARAGTRQELAQRRLMPAERQLLRDPPLTVGQVAEALIVEVVDEPMLAHHPQALAQAMEVAAHKTAHDDLEAVPVARLARQRGVGEAEAVDLELRLLESHFAAAGNAHVLDRDRLTILPASEADLGRLDAGLACEGRDRLGRRQLSFGHAVDTVISAVREIALVQELAHAKVADPLLQLHRE